jgi:hypothetical protein
VVIDEILAGDAVPEIKSVANMHLICRKYSFHAASPLTIKQPMNSAEAADSRSQSHYTIQTANPRASLWKRISASKNPWNYG